MELYADIGIVVARPEECAAVRCVFGATLVERPTRSDPNYYYESDLSTEAGTYRIIVVQAPKMGNSGAAIVATNLIQKYRVKHVIMVGIAAGIPNLRNEAKHVRLGDVVASYGDGVVQYDLGKRHPGGRFEIRSKMPLPSRLLTGAADTLKSDLLCGGQAPWLKYIAQAEPLGRKPPEESDKLEILTGKNKLRWKRVEHPQSAGPRESPRIHLGLIGSGTCLQKD